MGSIEILNENSSIVRFAVIDANSIFSFGFKKKREQKH